MPTCVTRISATTSLLLALAAGVGLLLWPCTYRGIEAQSARVVRSKPASCAPPSSRPTASTCSACSPCRCCLPVWGCSRSAPVGVASWPLWMVALVAFCLLTLASVGLLYLPAAAALVMAVVGWRQQPSAPPNGRPNQPDKYG
jgi:hypothetical protein